MKNCFLSGKGIPKRRLIGSKYGPAAVPNTVLPRYCPGTLTTPSSKPRLSTVSLRQSAATMDGHR